MLIVLQHYANVYGYFCTNHLELNYRPIIIEGNVLIYVLVSAISNVSLSCYFDDIDICGYEDLSDTGINWSQIHNQSEIISYCIDHTSLFHHVGSSIRKQS